MDVVASPLVTIILNIIASALVAHGILSVTSKDAFIQLANSAIAAGFTTIVAIYSIYKVVDLHKHKISSMTVTPTSSVKTDETVPISQGSTPPSVAQTVVPPVV